jgi:tRNA modification GTPase
MRDTIFAPATAAGRAAIAVVRLSGPATASAVRALIGRLPAPRRAAHATLRDPVSGAVLDDGLVLWFPAPASYTGEDCAELQIHGGTAVTGAVFEALIGLGLRLAEPGEFTRRAFENQKLDLTQAEAVADLIDAETQSQRRLALDQLAGGLSAQYGQWRTDLLGVLALLEAGIDFPDEDLPEALAEQARGPLAQLIGDLDLALADGRRGERIREGFRVAVIGAPNAGKSSLLNALAGREAAIVASTAGTTRDVIEIPLMIAGYRVLLADTAGVRAASEAIEAEGVRRARVWAAGAALRLWVVDGSLSNADWVLAQDLAEAGDLCVINKADLALGDDGSGAAEWAQARGLEVCRISVLSGGEAQVSAWLEGCVVSALSGADMPAATRLRHVEGLGEARKCLRRAQVALGLGAELAAEDVRMAARALERITGRIGTEEVLGQVFASFCIGK